ncbi:MAG: acyl-CoA/acyl-ACP dehydrogenase [bacterium]|nr:acyl-CoA/acyl-ACP dehydrogenase [bacterium]
MNFDEPGDFAVIRDEVRRLCSRYPGEYWQGLEPDRYPTEFVTDLAEHGWLGTLIPTDYGGGGLSLAGASVILEEIAASGANPSACHAQMYVMGALVRHGSETQKRRWLPEIAAGRTRMQAFGVTEPAAGSDTASITTRAVRDGDGWTLSGQKIWTSRALHSDLMLVLARTTPAPDAERRFDGLSIFIFEMRHAGGELVDGLTIRPIPTMMNHNSTEVFFDNVRLPADALVGTEGKGFSHILDGMNAERILIAAECVGDGRFFCERAAAYATERVVFGRPIGQNQGVAFPLARAYAAIEAASLMRFKAAGLFDAGKPCGPEANMAKLLASEASWAAGNAAVDTFGGFGFATEYDIERKLRETRLYQVAPVSNNLVLAYVARQCLGLPKSY